MNSAPQIETKKSRIFIVDDHPILRQGLIQLINQEDDMVSVGEAGTAVEAMRTIETASPDVMIVDISLEGSSGLELTKSILAKWPKILVLIISMYDESVYVERILRAGAKGYLKKREASNCIISAIHKVLSGEIYVSEKWRDRLVSKFAGQSTVTQTPFGSNLSDRELEVFQLAGQGFSTREIALELHVSVKTVESHYANIKCKLDLKNSHQLIQHAVKWRMSSLA